MSKRKLPEWIIEEHRQDTEEPKVKKHTAEMEKKDDEIKAEEEVGEVWGESKENVMLDNVRIAMDLLQRQFVEDKEWEEDKKAMDGNDSFEPSFELEKSTVMDYMNADDVLEIIFKIKGSDYISRYTYFDNLERLIADLDECFVHYCNIHGIPLEY